MRFVACSIRGPKFNSISSSARLAAGTGLAFALLLGCGSNSSGGDGTGGASAMFPSTGASGGTGATGAAGSIASAMSGSGSAGRPTLNLGSGGSGGRSSSSSGGSSGNAGTGATQAGTGGSAVGAGGAAAGGGGTGAGAGGSAAGAAGGGGMMALGNVPPDLPMPSGTCPDFKQGNLTFTPKSGGTRTVVVTMGASASTMSGPLIFYWYATGSSPSEAQRGLPISQVTAAGGIVVAPTDVPGAGQFPWLSQLSEHDDLFDEVLACALQKTKIDPGRIHAVGFSAGGLMTTHLGFSRSKYLASVASYSGGATGMFQAGDSKFAAMIMTGGAADNVFGHDFYMSSMDWQTALKGAGHFAMLCDHGGGHSIPTQLVPGVWQFFVDHPYGKIPSPYAGGHIPSGISPPCME